MGYVIGLDLSNSFLHCSINSSSSLFSLVQLQRLNLSCNDFDYSYIPPEICHLSELISLNLSSSVFSGQIPWEISKLSKFVSIDLSFSVDSSFSGLLKLEKLGLRSLLQNLTNLKVLRLNDVSISSEVPDTLANLTSLTTLVLENCGLRGFKQHPDILPWDNLIILHLSYNMMKGPLLIPPLATQSYCVAYSGLTRELPPLICRLRSLYTLDLSSNNLTRTIPPCLSTLSDSLGSGNKLQGKVPRSLASCTELGILDLSHNLIEDTFPFWLGDLTKLLLEQSSVLLMSLMKEEEAIAAQGWTMKHWSLKKSQSAIHSNLERNLKSASSLMSEEHSSKQYLDVIGQVCFRFGVGLEPKSCCPEKDTNNIYRSSSKMIIIFAEPLSRQFASKYFQNWIAMKFFDVNKMTYMYAPIEIPLNISLPWTSIYYFNMNITNKGVNIEYKCMLNIFTAIDLSSNKFEGVIPEFIGNLKGLQVLNLSNNDLNGGMPSCLGNLTNLESLDLSQNKLPGEIPQQLALLTFFEFLNVPNNNFTGPIPHGKQLNTFENNSYEGNLGLYGDPL
ncbi:receptor-like protein 6 [Camellia sinensis]|uniref:receptor-like protein 6 n=1 Tax=Camellia sinensis TaxID=4442 RepID=UPI001035CAB0|nr:receptor-like protein 6 [Camellia sinensis]